MYRNATRIISPPAGIPPWRHARGGPRPWPRPGRRVGSRPRGCPSRCDGAGSEEIGSPSRVRIMGAGGVLPSTGQNKRAYISLVNSRAEALGYKTRKIARLPLPGAPNGFFSRDTRFCLHVQVSYPSSTSEPHPTCSRLTLHQPGKALPADVQKTTFSGDR